MATATPDRGVLAEFGSAEHVLGAVQRLRELGYTRLDVFSPYPVSGVAGALRLPRPRIALWVMSAAAVGAVLAYLVQWYANAWDYPLNVGGRPLLAIPAWIPIMVATGVIFGALAALLALAVHTRLPALWHPVFEVEGFESASVDGFWLAVDRGDPRFEVRDLAGRLRDAGAERVVDFGGLGAGARETR